MENNNNNDIHRQSTEKTEAEQIVEKKIDDEIPFSEEYMPEKNTDKFTIETPNSKKHGFSKPYRKKIKGNILNDKS